MTRLRPVLGERPITIDVAPGLPLVRVDAVFFDAIVSNILDNIADHTPPGTPLAIRAGRTGEPGRVRLTIEDGGPGVPASDLEHIFDKFGRASRPGEGARRGMGVGLSIVQGMAVALDGSATARRSDLGGLAIDLDLPAAPEPPVEEACAMTDARAPTSCSSRTTRRPAGSVAANLVAHGYRVAEATDVRAALASWEAGRPDVILLDLGLPDADGLVLIRRVRRDATTPILVLSARDGEPDKVAALESGRRRLRHQAVRPARAARADRGAAAPLGRARRGHGGTARRSVRSSSTSRAAWSPSPGTRST